MLAAVPNGGSERASLDLSSGWKFIKSDVANAQFDTVSDDSWSTIDLPHTFNATDGADGGNNYFRGATWYRNEYTLSKVWAKRRVYINVGAAAINAQVYVNGQLVGSHKGDYSAFTIDITNALSGTTGQKSLIAIRVDNSVDATVPGYTGDFTKFGGLTRGVELFATNKLHVNSASAGASGVKVNYTNVSEDSATLNFTTNLRNDWTDTRNFTLRQVLVDAKGNVVTSANKSIKITRKKSLISYQSFTLNDPHLWNGVADPYLYTLYTQVDQGGSVLDTISTRIGVRSIETDADGLKLNGEHVTLKGVNLHDDRAGKGTALTQADRERDIKLITDMGANAVRFAHWQVDQGYYDLADEKGLIVWTEIGLWGQNGVPNTQAFLDNAENNLVELIRQNYNHASVAYWGLYNEIPDNSTTRSVITTLNALAHSEDGSRKTIGTTYDTYAQTVNAITDITTFNRYYGWYQYTGSTYSTPLNQRLAALQTYIDQQKSAQPGKPTGMGEFGAGGTIVHHTDDLVGDAPTSDPNSKQFQSEEYQAYVHEQNYAILKNSPSASFGNFIWQLTDSGNDNRNEAGMPGINTKGLFTYDRKYGKDAYYFYKSQWSSTPTLYLTSKRFTDRTDASTYVKAYSNLGVNVELFVNGQSQGTRNDSDGVLEWNVTLDGGANEIEVRATKSGKTYSETATWTLDASGSGYEPQSLGTTAAAASLAPSTKTSVTKDLFNDATPILV